MIEAFAIYSVLLMIFLWNRAHTNNINEVDFYMALFGISCFGAFLMYFALG